MGRKTIQYKKLDPDTLKEITNFVIERLREEETNESKIRYDKRRANTKTLLRNYRSLVEHCESAIYDATQISDDLELADILELMSGHGPENFKIESIRQSAARTRIIIDHIDEMLNIYKIFCDKSQKPEDSRRYRVIYWLYLADTPKTPYELSEEEFVELRTIYRDIDSAVERLTALIFGIDGLYLLKK